METVILMGIAVLAATVVHAQTVFVSNIEQAGDWTGAHWAGGQTTQFQAAGRFTTGSGSLVIGSLSLALRDASGPTAATFAVQLFSETAGLPGSAVATFTGPTNPSVDGTYNFVLGSGYTTTANTSYWIVASAPGQSANAYVFRWKVVNSDSATSAFGWSMGTQSASSNDGGATFAISNNELVFSVGASAVPEPTTYAAIFGAVVLGVAVWRRKSVTAK